MAKTTITYVGDSEYHSVDHDGKSIDLLPGESADVTAEKAAQVARDFPDAFGAAKPAAKKPAAKPRARKGAAAKPDAPAEA